MVYLLLELLIGDLLLLMSIGYMLVYCVFDIWHLVWKWLFFECCIFLVSILDLYLVFIC